MTLHLNNGVGIPKGSTLKTHSLMGPNFEFVCFFFKVHISKSKRNTDWLSTEDVFEPVTET